MKRSKFSEEQIVYAPSGKPESGTPLGMLSAARDCRTNLLRLEEIRPSERERAPPAAAGGRRETGSNGSWPSSPSTSTCRRRPCEKI